MKNLISLIAFTLMAAGPVTAEDTQAAQAAPAGSPVARWGALHIEGSRLVSSTGETVVLRGPSLFDTSSYGEYANAEVMAWLRDDWKASLFRVAMYTAYNGKFVGEGAYARVFQAIDAAIATGLYVLVDWHILSDGNPQVHKEQAKGFFAEVARRYAGVPNLIYEICNEPNGLGVNWPDVIKPYALEVIPVIRAADPQAIVVVGTPEWSSHPEVAAADPLPFDNVMYTLHFYAGSHDMSYIDRLDQAQAAGKAVFATEWGTTTAQVTGRPQVARTQAFIDALAQRQVSWANWSLGTKLEPTSILKPQASTQGNWVPGELTDSGLFVRSLVREEKTGPVFADNFDSGNFKGGGWVRNGPMLEKTVVLSGTAALRFEGKATMDKTLLSETVTGWKWSLQAKAERWKSSDRFVVEWSTDGKAWKTALVVKPTKEWARVEGTLPREAERTEALIFRLRSDFRTEAARLWVDDVEVQGTRD